MRPGTAETLCSVGRFYRKARISGQLDWECIPCTKQTPSSEPQCKCPHAIVPGRVLWVGLVGWAWRSRFVECVRLS